MSVNLEDWYDKIYRYCFFKVKNRETAEDLTQEAFLHYLGSGSYQDTGRALRYLYTIARNLCVDEFRKRQPEELPEDMPGHDLTDRLVNGIMVRQAVEELSEEDRELVLLRYAGGLEPVELCRILRISRFTLYRRTNRILKQLREKLGEEEV